MKTKNSTRWPAGRRVYYYLPSSAGSWPYMRSWGCLITEDDQLIASKILKNASKSELCNTAMQISYSTLTLSAWEKLLMLHHFTPVDTTNLTLSGEKLQCWREITLNAPSATQLKVEERNYISFAGDCISRELLIEKLAAAIAYDKHGLLDLII